MADSRTRIFGSAIEKVQQQDVGRSHDVNGSSIQVPAKESRRSVFDRMDGPPPTDAMTGRRSGWGRSGSDSRGNRTVTLSSSSSRRVYGRSRASGTYSDDDIVPMGDGPYRRRRFGARSSPYEFGWGGNRRRGDVDYGDLDGDTGGGGRSVRITRSRTTSPSPGRGGPEPKWRHDRFDGTPAANPGSQVYVRNLSRSVHVKDLTTFFSKAGTVCGVHIERGPLTTATVSFVRKDAAFTAQEKLHGQRLLGEKVKVAVLEDKPKVRTNDQDVTVTDTRRTRSSDEAGGDFLPNAEVRKSIFERLG